MVPRLLSVFAIMDMHSRNITAHRLATQRELETFVLLGVS